MGNKAVFWRPTWCPGAAGVLWIALGLTWLAIVFGGPWRLSADAERSPYHQVCPLDGKPAYGTRTYAGKNGRREVYLCSAHLDTPPKEIPENNVVRFPYSEDVLWAFWILFLVLVGGFKSGGYRRHPRAIPAVALALSLYVLLRTTGGGLVWLSIISGFLASMLLLFRMLPKRPRWQDW